MRIKIKGEITAERLAEALHAAAEKYEAVRPGHKVYGANLYLTAFDVHIPTHGDRSITFMPIT